MYDDNIDYAKQRLEQTVIRLNTGEAVYVNSVDKIGKDIIYSVTILSTEEHASVKAHQLNFESVPLGYVNSSNKKCAYVSRIPKRRDWRQGVRRENIIAFGNEGDNTRFDVTYVDMAKTIQNQYPSYKDALKTVNKQFPVIAFCRDFAVDYLGNIFYKSFKVGTIEKLSDNYSYLKEYLEEMKNA